jgi:hypothetical protein
LLELARTDMLDAGAEESCHPMQLARDLGTDVSGEDAAAAIPGNAL